MPTKHIEDKDLYGNNRDRSVRCKSDEDYSSSCSFEKLKIIKCILNSFKGDMNELLEYLDVPTLLVLYKVTELRNSENA